MQPRQLSVDGRAARGRLQVPPKLTVASGVGVGRLHYNFRNGSSLSLATCHSRRRRRGRRLCRRRRGRYGIGDTDRCSPTDGGLRLERRPRGHRRANGDAPPCRKPHAYRNPSAHGCSDSETGRSHGDPRRFGHGDAHSGGRGYGYAATDPRVHAAGDRGASRHALADSGPSSDSDNYGCSHAGTGDR